MSVLVLLIAVSRFAFAQGPDVEKAAESELPSLLSIYKDIHAHPELSDTRRTHCGVGGEGIERGRLRSDRSLRQIRQSQAERLRRRRRDEEWRRPDRARAHRHGCVAGRGGNRPALREQGHDEERQGPRSPRHARLRSRRPHGHFHRRGARAARAERPMARHDRLRRRNRPKKRSAARAPC